MPLHNINTEVSSMTSQMTYKSSKLQAFTTCSVGAWLSTAPCTRQVYERKVGKLNEMGNDKQGCLQQTAFWLAWSADSLWS